MRSGQPIRAWRRCPCDRYLPLVLARFRTYDIPAVTLVSPCQVEAPRRRREGRSLLGEWRAPEDGVTVLSFDATLHKAALPLERPREHILCSCDGFGRPTSSQFVVDRIPPHVPPPNASPGQLVPRTIGACRGSPERESRGYGRVEPPGQHRADAERASGAHARRRGVARGTARCLAERRSARQASPATATAPKIRIADASPLGFRVTHCGYAKAWHSRSPRCAPS